MATKCGALLRAPTVNAFKLVKPSPSTMQQRREAGHSSRDLKHTQRPHSPFCVCCKPAQHGAPSF
eukprot:1001578-Amphidinium_carterae.1